jgi:CheY-like chemotaxis protein
MDFITTQGVDLIMLDLSMQDTDGFQVLEVMSNDAMRLKHPRYCRECAGSS